MTSRVVLLAAAILIASAVQAQAQAQSPGAASAAAPKPHSDSKRAEKAEKKETPTSGAGSVVGKTLKLNGAAGALELSKGADDKSLKIEKLTLSGEVISNPAQKCEISIVGEGGIDAASQGSPDGVPRYAAEIPACPLSFDVVNSGVIVPPQTRACVFQAADCQASPSGVWGPDAVSLAAETKAIAKNRSHAETSIAESLKILGKRAKGAAAELEKEQSDFTATREEICRDYDDEATHGFCDAGLTEARAALLRKQAAKARKEAASE